MNTENYYNINDVFNQLGKRQYLHHWTGEEEKNVGNKFSIGSNLFFVKFPNIIRDLIQSDFIEAYELTNNQLTRISILSENFPYSRCLVGTETKDLSDIIFNYEKKGKKINQNNPFYNNVVIPKEQLDYVLKTGRRWKERDFDNISFPIIYEFTNDNNITKSLNKDESALKRNLFIHSSNDWIRNTEELDLNSDYYYEPYLIAFGINLEYYRRLSLKDVEILDNMEGINFRHYEIYEFAREIEAIVKWDNSWSKFIKNLYENGIFIYDNLSRFEKFLRETNRMPTHFDSYKKLENFKIGDFNKWFSKEKSLTKEEAACIVMGLEPEYYLKYSKCIKTLSEQGNKSISSLGCNKEIFFYRYYNSFLSSLAFDTQCNLNLIGDFQYNGDLTQFIAELNNQGFVLSENLLSYTPNLSKESWVYKHLKYWTSKPFWSLQESFNIIAKGEIGKDFDKKFLTFLDRTNVPFLTWDERNNKLFVTPKNTIKSEELGQLIELYIRNGDIKCEIINNAKFFKPKEILDWFKEFTQIKPAEIIYKILEEKSNSKDAIDKKLENKKRGPDDKKFSSEDIIVWKHLINGIEDNAFVEESFSHSALVEDKREHYAKFYVKLLRNNNKKPINIIGIKKVVEKIFGQKIEFNDNIARKRFLNYINKIFKQN